MLVVPEAWVGACPESLANEARRHDGLQKQDGQEAHDVVHVADAPPGLGLRA